MSMNDEQPSPPWRTKHFHICCMQCILGSPMSSTHLVEQTGLRYIPCSTLCTDSHLVDLQNGILWYRFPWGKGWNQGTNNYFRYEEMILQDSTTYICALESESTNYTHHTHKTQIHTWMWQQPSLNGKVTDDSCFLLFFHISLIFSHKYHVLFV